MSESDFSQSMPSHEAAFVNITIDSVQSTFTCILPHLEVSAVCQYGFPLGVLGNHELVAVQLAQQIMVVEVGSSIDERLLSVGFFNQMQELEQRVAELLSIQSALGLHVYHRQQVLIPRSALCDEILQLRLLRNPGAVEVVGSYLEPVPVSQVNILLILGVYVGSAFSSFQIDISHLGIITYSFPKDIPLVMAEVNTMHMTAGIFTLNLSMKPKGKYNGNYCYDTSFHNCKDTKNV